MLVSYPKPGRELRRVPTSPIEFCPSPVAKSGPLERADSEWWVDSLTRAEGAMAEE